MVNAPVVFAVCTRSLRVEALSSSPQVAPGSTANAVTSTGRGSLTVADFAPPGLVGSSGLMAVLPQPEASEMSNAPLGPQPNELRSGGLAWITWPPVATSAQSRCRLKSRVWLAAVTVTLVTVSGWWPDAEATTAG